VLPASIGGRWIETLTGFEKVEAEVAYLEPPSGAGIELICYRVPEGNLLELCDFGRQVE